MSTYVTKNGKQYLLDMSKSVYKSEHISIYCLDRNQNIFAKIFNKNLTTNKQNNLNYLINNPLNYENSAEKPIALLYNENNKKIAAGFSYQRGNNFKPFKYFYYKENRIGYSWDYFISTAMNLSACLYDVISYSKYNIHNFTDKMVEINLDTSEVLITRPEFFINSINSKNQTLKKQNLLVIGKLIFYLLFHVDIDKFSSINNLTIYKSLPTNLQKGFNQIKQKDLSNLPSIQFWHNNLKLLNDNLTNCKYNSSHMYWEQASSCPWCKHNSNIQKRKYR